MDINKIAIKGTTQNHLPIETIKDDLVLLKDGSCVMILETSSVNFDLLSEKEQDAMIYAYAALLNSLTFPIQILIRSTVKDVSTYVNRLKQQEMKVVDSLMRKQITAYRQFVEEVVKKNNVLAKSFHIIIPFFSIELGVQAAAKSTFPNPFKTLSGSKGGSNLPMEQDKILEKAQAGLESKKEHLIRLFNRLGLTIKQLTTKELIKLFYEIYNQESILVKNTDALNQQGTIIRGKKPLSPLKNDHGNSEQSNTKEK